MSLRRSSRESKKPEFYTVESRSSKRSTQEEEIVTDSDSDDFDDDSDTENQPKTAKASSSSSSSPSSAAATTTTKKISNHRKVSQKGDFVHDLGFSEIFSVVLRGSIGEIKNCISEWINRQKTDSFSAVNELMNFVLLASGARKIIITDDIDLEGLDSDEIHELLQDMANNENDSIDICPLLACKIGRNSSSYRDSYSTFWFEFSLRLVSEVYSSVDLNMEAGNKSSRKETSDFDLLLSVIDHLTSFSSLNLFNVRDGATEALLSIGKAIVRTQKYLIDHKEMANKARSNKRRASDTSRIQSVQVESFQRLITQIDEVLESLFNSIFVHRFKDTHSEIRILCGKKLMEWMDEGPMLYLTQEYMKYIGWMLYDGTGKVRKCACSIFFHLLKKYPDAEVFSETIRQFQDRFFEIAAGDIDNSVSVEMITLLRSMQEFGHLDSISEKQLDIVDRIVFDSGASPKLRKEALLFMMDHTEGFDDVASNAENGNKRKRKESNTSKQISLAMTVKRLHAIQLETLLEFAEHHLKESYDGIELLAQACLESHHFEIMWDWEVIVQLLLRENNEIISLAISNRQAEMLLSMLLFVVKDLQKRVQSPHSDDKKRSNSSGTVLDKATIQKSWQSLNNDLAKSSSKLLVRHQDQGSNIENLLRIIASFDAMLISKDVLQHMFKTLEGFFQRIEVESILALLASIFRNWSSALEMRSSIDNVFEKYIHDGISNIFQFVEELRKEIEHSGSGTGKELSGLINAGKLHSWNISLLKFKCLWKQRNCIPWITKNLDEKLSSFWEISTLFDKYWTNILQSPLEVNYSNISANHLEIFYQQCSIVKECMTISYLRQLWKFQELTQKTKGIQVTATVGSNVEHGVEYSWDDLWTERDELVNFLSWVLGLGMNASNKNCLVYKRIRELHRTAFQLVGDLRVLFSAAREKALNLALFSVFQPSSELYQAMVEVFDEEGYYFRQSITSCNELETSLDNGAAETISDSFVEGLVKPMCHALIWDGKSMNRRQAAALATYLMPPTTPSLVNCLHSFYSCIVTQGEIGRLLEIQFVALKSFYQEHLLPLLSNLLTRTGWIENDDEYENILSKTKLESLTNEEWWSKWEEELTNLCLFAERLSSLLSSSKEKSTKEFGANFFSTSIKFAMSLPVGMGIPFLCILPSFANIIFSSSRTPIPRALCDEWYSILIQQSFSSPSIENESEAEPKLTSCEVWMEVENQLEQSLDIISSYNIRQPMQLWRHYFQKILDRLLSDTINWCPQFHEELEQWSQHLRSKYPAGFVNSKPSSEKASVRKSSMSKDSKRLSNNEAENSISKQKLKRNLESADQSTKISKKRKSSTDETNIYGSTRKQVDSSSQSITSEIGAPVKTYSGKQRSKSISKNDKTIEKEPPTTSITNSQPTKLYLGLELEDDEELEDAKVKNSSEDEMEKLFNSLPPAPRRSLRR